jgi:hypothetical protein
MGTVTGDVGVIAPVNDVVRPLPTDGLAAVVVATPDPVTPGGGVVPVEPGDVVIEPLPGASDDVLLPSVDILELIDDGSDEVGELCVNSSEIPLLPSTDPVWTLTIGLQGLAVAGG